MLNHIFFGIRKKNRRTSALLLKGKGKKKEENMSHNAIPSHVTPRSLRFVVSRLVTADTSHESNGNEVT